MNLKPYLIDRELLPEVWDQLEPMIRKSCEASQGMASVDQVLAMLMNGDAVCFGVSDNGRPMLVLVVTLVQYPLYRAARVIALAGTHLKEGMQHFNVLKEWALKQGAVEIEGWCKPSVARLHSRIGGKPKVSIVTWDLRGSLQ